MQEDKEKSEINKPYFLYRVIINKQAPASNRPTPWITLVGINILLYAKIIIQFWIRLDRSNDIKGWLWFQLIQLLNNFLETTCQT